MRTIDKIITKMNCQYGAPMGRHNTNECPTENVNGVIYTRFTGKVFDCAVPMSGDGAYDRGGAYWGLGKQLRVMYTKDLKYIQFYRKG